MSQDPSLYHDIRTNKIHVVTSPSMSLLTSSVPMTTFYHPIVQVTEISDTHLSIRDSNKKNATLTFSKDSVPKWYIVSKYMRQTFFKWGIFENMDYVVSR